MSRGRRVKGVIVVFAKSPESGRVKTRLSPPLSPDEAAEFYACMLDDVLETTADAARELEFDAVLAVDPPAARDWLARRAPSGFRVVAQRGGDLGTRMAHAAEQAAAGGARRILLRGSDSPALPIETLAAAAAALEEVDLVVCPDPDGGYSLVGLRRPVAGLFDHAMSHAGVLEATCDRAERARLSTRLLPPSFDLDTAEDLTRLAECRARRGALPCPRTLAWLDRHRAWPEIRA